MEIKTAKDFYEARVCGDRKFPKPKPNKDQEKIFFNSSNSFDLFRERSKPAEPIKLIFSRVNPSRQVFGSDASQRTIHELIKAQNEGGWTRISKRRSVKIPLSPDIIRRRRLCFRCGLGDHMAFNCRNNHICYFCRRPGHEAKFCYQNPNRLQVGVGRGGGRQQEPQSGDNRRGEQQFRRLSGDGMFQNSVSRFQADRVGKGWGQDEGYSNFERSWDNRRHGNKWRESNSRNTDFGMWHGDEFPTLRSDQGQERNDKGKCPMNSANIQSQKKLKCENEKKRAK